MRSEIVRVYKTVHTWTGILTGMALFIAFYAGAITLFKEPLVVWATPPADPVESAEATPLADAPRLIERTLASQPEAAKGFQIHVSREVHKADLLEWSIHEEGADEHDALSVRHFVARLGHDGALRTEEVERSHLAEFIDVLHRVVGLPVDSDENRLFMGVVAGLYFLALFSGLITLLPSLVKDFFALRVGPNLKRMWLDAHNVVGLGSFPFHIVIALTATVFAFHDPIYMVQNGLIHDGKLGAMISGAGGPPSKDAKPRDTSTMLPPAELIARVRALNPRFEPTHIRYMRVTTPAASAFVFGHDTRMLEQRGPGSIAMMDPYSGRIANSAYLTGQEGLAETILTSLFALHFASYGGTPVKLIYFVLGLLGAWLVYSGNLLWIESRRKKARKAQVAGEIPVQRRDTMLMASATVGVCLGAVCGISLTICSAKWLHGHVESLNDWHRLVYYAAFFGALVWSFVRGAARGAVELLSASAALTLAIPLTTLAGLTVPALGLWAHLTPASLAVDVVALVLALAFALMARGTARRVYEGPTDSVWTAHPPAPAGAGPATDPAAAE